MDSNGQASTFASRDEAVVAIQECIIDLFPDFVGNSSPLVAEQRVSELGLDSILLMEMVIAIEDRMRRPLDERALSKADTIGAIADLMVDGTNAVRTRQA